ncbi:adhesion G protein-coupled receptor B2 [Trichonephila clavipes]|nr:adhesion G protein-coupled receptor B2 [Trichonephila clavipes]
MWISFTPNAAVLFVDVAIQPEVRFIAVQNSLMKFGNNGNLVLGPFDESTPCLMIVLMNRQTKLIIKHLTAVKSVDILEREEPGYPRAIKLPLNVHCVSPTISNYLFKDVKPLKGGKEFGKTRLYRFRTRCMRSDGLLNHGQVMDVNFEPWSSDADGTSSGTPSPNYHTNTSHHYMACYWA